MVVLGLTLAIFASVQLVKVASMIAISMNVPHAIVGTTMSGLGTSLPELTVALLASKRSQGVAIGTLIGSNITDPLLSIGIAAIINPLAMTSEGNILIMHLIVPATIIGVVTCLIFMRSGFKFNRREGIILTGIYLLFLMILELHRQGYISL